MISSAYYAELNDSEVSLEVTQHVIMGLGCETDRFVWKDGGK